MTESFPLRPGSRIPWWVRISGAFLFLSLLPVLPAEGAQRLPAARAVLLHPDGTKEEILVEDLRFVYFRRRLIKKSSLEKTVEDERSRTKITTRAVDERKESRSLQWNEEFRTRLNTLRELRFDYQEGEDGIRRLIIHMTRRGGQSFQRKGIELIEAHHHLGLFLAGRVDGEFRDLPFPPLFAQEEPVDGPTLMSLLFLDKDQLP